MKTVFKRFFSNTERLSAKKTACRRWELKTMQAIERCGTDSAGFHSFICEHCGHTEVTYNSCRNRHCPHCQWLKQEIWIDSVKSRLLPVRHVHLVFTLPEFINEFVLINHKLIYGILFDASWHAVQKCAASHLGVQTGALSVLHTWGQNLSLHPHIHMLVPAGGLDEDGMQWIQSPANFFLPVRALSKIFRARVLFLILQALFDKSLNIPEGWSKKNVAHDLKKLVGEKDWVVDYADKGKQKKLTLDAMEFLRRFMLHVLPQRFCKVRYYGILSIKNRKTKLARCLELIGKAQLPPRFQGLDLIRILQLLTGIDYSICPCCQTGRMKRYNPLE